MSFGKLWWNFRTKSEIDYDELLPKCMHACRSEKELSLTENSCYLTDEISIILKVKRGYLHTDLLETHLQRNPQRVKSNIT